MISTLSIVGESKREMRDLLAFCIWVTLVAVLAPFAFQVGTQFHPKSVGKSHAVEYVGFQLAQALKDSVQTKQQVVLDRSDDIIGETCQNDTSVDGRRIKEKRVEVTVVDFPQGFGQELSKKHDDGVEEEDDNDDDDDDDDDDVRLPVEGDGPDQQTTWYLKIDLEFVDGAFLRSLDWIRETLMEAIWELSSFRELKVDSISCKENVQTLSCTAQAKAGHYLHVNSFPSRRILLLSSVFRGGGSDDGLEPEASCLVRHFSVKGEGSRPVRPKWYSFQLFGPKKNEGRWMVFQQDIGDDFAERGHKAFYKSMVAHQESMFQIISVVDLVDATQINLEKYEETSTTTHPSYANEHQEFFQPVRQLFLDGVLQSTSRGDAAYHEGLVHPGMFAHPTGARRVAIIGGGEGATLREVLKHRSVEHCKMIEIDAGMVQAAKDFLPKMNDCTSFSPDSANDNVVVNCFEESRADLQTVDAVAWFRNNFGHSPSDEELFDVVIMDALDPQDPSEFAKNLYKDTAFWNAIKGSLTEDGILVMQMGTAPHILDPADRDTDCESRDVVLELIEAIGFEVMHIYNLNHAGFLDPWSVLVACKTQRCNENWYSNVPQLDTRIRRMIYPRHEDRMSSLEYFDGTTMQEYQVPDLSWEAIYCRKFPRPTECQSDYPSHRVPKDSLFPFADVKRSDQLPSVTGKWSAIRSNFFHLKKLEETANGTRPRFLLRNESEASHIWSLVRARQRHN